jgi:lipoprotein-releasing system ATP-binding protein
MSAQISLGCERIERYLGEEEERVHALRGVSLEIETGSVHAVVGPSGCGKSSLLYILGLLDTPDAGRVSIETETVSHLTDDELAQKRNKFIGFIFQFHFLMEDFTAQENVMIRCANLASSPMRRCAIALPSCLMAWAWATNCDGPAVIFPAASNNASPSHARWRTTRTLFLPTNRPGI